MFRNRELKTAILICAIFSFTFAAVMYILYDMLCAVLSLLALTAVTAAMLIPHIYRYKRIARLSANIENMLDGIPCESFTECNEGELAILSSELKKVTDRLSEAADILQNDKVHLMNSIADISHQLRTPLTSINLMLSMLAQEDIAPERRTELIGSLKLLLSRINWLIDALLKLSKIDAKAVTFAKDNVNVSRLIDTALSPLEAALDIRGQQIKTAVTDEHLTCDLAWTAEALSNILKNCSEHAGDGGKISICANRTPIYIEITVKDSGNGFDKADLPHIFERFYKGKSSSQGFGIGLALARKIIHTQGGTIKAENAVSGGALFTIRFYE